MQTTVVPRTHRLDELICLRGGLQRKLDFSLGMMFLLKAVNIPALTRQYCGGCKGRGKTDPRLLSCAFFDPPVHLPLSVALNSPDGAHRATRFRHGCVCDEGRLVTLRASVMPHSGAQAVTLGARCRCEVRVPLRLAAVSIFVPEKTDSAARSTQEWLDAVSNLVFDSAIRKSPERCLCSARCGCRCRSRCGRRRSHGS